MKTLLLIVALMGATNAMENFFSLGEYTDEMGVTGQGCCLPTQWEGRVGAVHVTKRFLKSKVRASDSKVGLDFEGKKVAARSMFYCARTKKIAQSQTVVDFNAKRAYFIYKNKCKTFQVRRPLNRPCIPNTFRKFPSYFYGADNSSLQLTPYGYRNGSLSVFSVVTRDSCVPVKAAYMVKRRFHSHMGSYQYFNITLGNEDEDLYKVPDFCNTNKTANNSGSVMNRLKKFVSYTDYKDDEFHSESELTGQVKDDPLTQLMDIVNESTGLTILMEEEHVHSSDGRIHWN